MRQIVLVVGLPGSGKTFFAHEHFPDALIIDDPRDRESDLPSHDDFETLVITDPHLCRDEILKTAITILSVRYRVDRIAVTFFENDPVKAKANVKLRNDGRKVEWFIDTLTKIYEPPHDAMPIWSMN
jgi:hypothetical protein